MVSLSKAKRMLYEKAQPQFWRYAGEECDKAQEKWFKELLVNENHVMFTTSSFDKASTDKESDTKEILGFIIGKLMPAPEVYNPGGLTLMIDDFCVKSENLWQSVGAKLIEEIKAVAKAIVNSVAFGARSDERSLYIIGERRVTTHQMLIN